MAYRVEGYKGIAWQKVGMETTYPEPEPYHFEDDDPKGCEDESHWSYVEDSEPIETGRWLMVMVGDDRVFTFDPTDVEPISDDEYCAECGQIGCGGDFRG